MANVVDFRKASRRRPGSKWALLLDASWNLLSGWVRSATARWPVPSIRAPSPPEKARDPLTIGDAALSRARSLAKKPPDPFALPAFPPNVVPKDTTAQMAMDDATSWASTSWGASWIHGVLAEGLAFPGYAHLAELAQRPEYRRFAEILATEMTRKWIKLQSVGDDKKTDKINRIKECLDHLRARDTVQRCIELDELFGRSHLYIDTGATDDRDELKTSLGSGRDEISRSKVGKGISIKALRAVEPVWCYPTSYNSNNPLKADWYEPTTWFVLGTEVHKTRLLKFVGREVPDLLKPAYSFGGLSMTQMSKPYVDNWLRTRQSVADLIHAFSVFVLKTDLGASLVEGAELLFRRVELFNALRDNRGLMMVNKDSEDLTNVSAPLGGLEQLQAQTQEHLAAVSGIPIVKLLGIQPTGLNASDEGGIRMFYDWILASQEKRLRPNLTTLIDLVQLSEFGEIDEEITFAFVPLWSLDEKAEAEMREVEARTDVSLIDAGVISPAEVRERVAADEDSPYASIDVEDVPDLREEEMGGLDPRAGGGEKGIGKPPKLPGGEEDHGDEDESEDSDEELSPFEQRVAARGERHRRGEGSFYDRVTERRERNQRGETPFHERARDRAERNRNYLRDRSSQNARPFGAKDAKWEESKHPRDKRGRFGKGGGSGGESSEQPRSYEPGGWADLLDRSIIPGNREPYDQLIEQIKKLKLKEINNIAREFTGETSSWGSKQAALEAIDRERGRIRESRKASSERAGGEIHKRITDIAMKVAKAHGFKDLNKVKVSDEDKNFQLNGQNHKYAGSFTPSTGEVTLYTKHLSEHAAGQVMAHEIMHAKYQHATERYAKDSQAMMQEPKPTSSRDDFMRPDGSLKPPYDEKYPDYTAMFEAYYGVDKKVFEDTDGVSAYSQEWWTAYKAGKARLDQAVNETLAEMSALRYKNLVPGTPVAEGEMPKPYGNRLISYRGENRIGKKEEEESHAAWERLFRTVERLYAE